MTPRITIDEASIHQIFEEQFPKLDHTRHEDWIYLSETTLNTYVGFLAAVKWAVNLTNDYTDAEFMEQAALMTAQVNDAC